MATISSEFGKVQTLTGFANILRGMDPITKDMGKDVSEEMITKQQSELAQVTEILASITGTINNLNIQTNGLTKELADDLIRVKNMPQTKILQPPGSSKTGTSNNAKIKTAMESKMNKKAFNLKKYSQMDMPAMEETPMADGQFDMSEEPPIDQPEIDLTKGDILDSISSPIEFVSKLEDEFKSSGDVNNMRNAILKSDLVDSSIKENVADDLKNYIESSNEKARELIGFEIYKKVFGEESNDVQTIEAPIIEANNIINIIKESEETIKKQAQEDVKKQNGFNMKRFAQAKTIENMIMYMPNNNSEIHKQRIDPFLKQPINDWHIVERNKGFGLVLDDVWNTDWESIWRGTIMDKYSQPYRDKDGNWVGGYIQKRFEVDKWIPEETNMQLKPGQRRRAYVPEYRSIEARMEAQRNNKEIASTAKGEATEWSEEPVAKADIKLAEVKPFNLKKKTDKVAQNLITSIDDITSKNPFEAKKKLKPNYKCIPCSERASLKNGKYTVVNWAVDDDTLQPAPKCNSCGTAYSPQVCMLISTKSAPDKKKTFASFNLSKFSQGQPPAAPPIMPTKEDEKKVKEIIKDKKEGEKEHDEESLIEQLHEGDIEAPCGLAPCKGEEIKQLTMPVENISDENVQNDDIYKDKGEAILLEENMGF